MNGLRGDDPAGVSGLGLFSERKESGGPAFGQCVRAEYRFSLHPLGGLWGLGGLFMQVRCTA